MKELIISNTAIFIFVLIAISIVTFGVLIYCYYTERKCSKTIMSFKESLDLVGLPIVTFYQGDRKYNFLLDTGASSCILNYNCDLELSYIQENSCNYYGCDGVKKQSSFGKAILYYKNNKYEADFLITDLQQAFDNVKKESGVTIHGILGSDFFTKYKYVLNFDNYVAYSKK